MTINKEYADAFFGPQIRFQEGVQERLDKMHREEHLKLKELTAQVLDFAADLDSKKLSSELTRLVYGVRLMKLEDLEAIHGENY
jgi:hypothetical protein